MDLFCCKLPQSATLMHTKNGKTQSKTVQCSCSKRKWIIKLFGFALTNNAKMIVEKSKQFFSRSKTVVIIWLHLLIFLFSVNLLTTTKQTKNVSMNGNIMAATLTLLILIIHESGCDSRRSVCKRKLRERERVKNANANTENKYKLIGREKNKKHTDI